MVTRNEGVRAERSEVKEGERRGWSEFLDRKQRSAAACIRSLWTRVALQEKAAE